MEPDQGGGSLLTTSGDDLHWTAAYLGALPWELEVIEPPELRDAFRDLGARLIRAAGPYEATRDSSRA